MLLEPEGKSGKGGDGFDVMKSGDARVALIVRPPPPPPSRCNKGLSSR